MTDNRVETLADILVDYSTQVKKGDLVSIRGAYVAEPLLLALYKRCLEREAYPLLRASIPRAEPIFYRFAKEHQLEFIWETDRWLIENLTASITVISDTNTRQLSRIPTEKQAIVARSRRPMMERYFERAAAKELRWNVTLYPTEALAMEAEMSLDEYEDLYYEACLIGTDDPVAEWKKVAERHRRMIDWIKGRQEVHLEGEGTDLYLDVTERTFLPADGKENFPDGEIFTGPHEDKTKGHVTFSFPAIYGGQVVEGIRLEFEKGRVVNASAQRNEEFLIKTLDTDPGARVLGELGIGTNFGIKDFTGETLLDEKIGGTVHLAVGASYPESGGVNQSAVHWDMVCDLRKGGRVTVDGDPLMEDGKLLV
ncbi:MAG TPA: aminopeptidase [Actinomycetota bacterium]|nr:aminopeptidase [Actinomycetota bacterium]